MQGRGRQCWPTNHPKRRTERHKLTAHAGARMRSDERLATGRKQSHAQGLAHDQKDAVDAHGEHAQLGRACTRSKSVTACRPRPSRGNRVMDSSDVNKTTQQRHTTRHKTSHQEARARAQHKRGCGRCTYGEHSYRTRTKKAAASMWIRDQGQIKRVWIRQM